MKKEKEVVIKGIEKHYTDTIYEGPEDGLPEKMKVVYRDGYWTKKKEHCLHQESYILIGNDWNNYFTMRPALDPCLKIEEGIVYCTSDGKLELFDTETKKGVVVPMSIVSFGYENHIEVTDKFITVTGTGCYWGVESWPVDFEIKLTKKNLVCIKNIVIEPEEEENGTEDIA